MKKEYSNKAVAEVALTLEDQKSFIFVFLLTYLNTEQAITVEKLKPN